jgi:hypothetical protein
MVNVIGQGLLGVNDVSRRDEAMVEVLGPEGVVVMGWSNARDLVKNCPDKFSFVNRNKAYADATRHATNRSVQGGLNRGVEWNESDAEITYAANRARRERAR